MGKSTPDAPDYVGAAEATAASDREMLDLQTHANRPDQFTPWGSSTWEQGSGGDWTQNINLSPEQQAALDAQLGLQQGRSELAGGLMSRVQEEFGDTMDWSQFTDLAGPVMGGSGYNEQAGEALYGRATSRLDPQFEQRAESLESSLRNQGLRPGDEAYDNAMDNFERERTDAYQAAGFGADIGAGAEASRMQGQDIAAGGFSNQLRQQEIAEMMQQRGFSLNEINAILTGQQVGMPSMPGFNQAGRSQGVDYTGAATSGYNAEMDQFSADQAMMQSVMNAGASAMSFSDIRLKRNVKLIGKWNEYKIYIWDWIWGGKGCGVMAHEMPPEYLATHESGYLMVDYGRL